MANDILLENNDLKITGGDLAIGYSDEQHIEQITVANKGDYKQYPVVGVAITKMLNAPISYKVKRKIEKQIAVQLQYDKAKNIKVEFNDTIKIQADYD